MTSFIPCSLLTNFWIQEMQHVCICTSVWFSEVKTCLRQSLTSLTISLNNIKLKFLILRNIIWTVESVLISNLNAIVSYNSTWITCPWTNHNNKHYLSRVSIHICRLHAKQHGCSLYLLYKWISGFLMFFSNTERNFHWHKISLSTTTHRLTI
jgi:hypothetical protein